MALASKYEVDDANRKYKLYRKQMKRLKAKEVMNPKQFAAKGYKHYRNSNSDQTDRTKQVSQRLRVAGLTEEEINRLRR